MKKAQSLVAGCLLSLALVQASAVTYLDQDTWTPDFDDLGFIPNVPPILSFKFDLRSVAGGGDPSDTTGTDIRGYDPATQQILSAVASFQLYTDGINGSKVTVVSMELVTLTESWSGSGDLFGTDPSDAAQMALLVATLQDGFINGQIASTLGSFFVASATLTAEVGPRQSSSVPDGGSTLGLLGAALVTLEGARRRFAR